MTRRTRNGVDPRPLKILTAADVMTRNPKSIRYTTTAIKAAKFFSENAIHSAPIIDDEGRPIGVVSNTDLLDYGACRRDRLADFSNGEAACNPTNAGLYHKCPDFTVMQIMTPAVFCVPTDAPISKVIKKMVALKVRCLFVTDQAVLVGGIDVFDLLKSVAQSLKRAGRSRKRSRRLSSISGDAKAHGRQLALESS